MASFQVTGKGDIILIRNLTCYIRYTIRSLDRNRWMGLASVATTAIALFILGVFILAMLNVQMISKNIESNLEIVVWLESESDKTEVEDIKTYIINISDVTQVKYTPKEEGLKYLNSNYFGSETDLLETLGGDNPLPDYLVVKVSNSEFVKKVASQINRLPYVDYVDYGQEYLDKLLNLLYWGRLIGTGIVILFLISVIFLIANTIRLTIYARSKEIQIMKFVGATNWFIRWPFLMEGMVLGFAGSLFAAAVLCVSYILIVDNVAQYVNFIPLIKDNMVLYFIGLVMIGLGTILGGFASFLSLGKYLRI